MKYSELKKIADPMIARIYTDLGFKQAGKGVTKFKKKVTPYCTQIIYYTSSGQGLDCYSILPVIWIEQSLPTIVFERMTGERVADACMGLNMPHISKKAPLEWEFTSDMDFEKVVADIREKMVKYAIPYLNENINLKKFLNVYLDNGLFNSYYLIPVIYYMIGKPKKGIKYMEENMEEVMSEKMNQFPPWIPPTVRYNTFLPIFKDYVRDNPFRMEDYEGNE